MATTFSPLSFTRLTNHQFVGRRSRPKPTSRPTVVRVCSKINKLNAATFESEIVRSNSLGPIQTQVSNKACNQTLSYLRDTEGADFQIVETSNEEQVESPTYGLFGESIPATDNAPPSPYLIREGDSWALGYRYDSDVINADLEDEVGAPLVEKLGKNGKDADRYFRRAIHEKANNYQTGRMPDVLHEELLPAALKVFGEHENLEAKKLTRVYSTYANVLLPGQRINLHLDTPEFRGLDHTNCPSWLLVVARASGLFDDYRVRSVTSVFHPASAAGGAMAVYPHIDGVDATDAKVYPVTGGSAVVVDSDSHYHHSELVGLNALEAPQLPESCTITASVAEDGSHKWSVTDLASGEVVQEYDESELRFSVSCKFHVFGSREEVDLYENGPKLTVDTVLSKLCAELSSRGKLDGDETNTALTELAPLFVEEFVTPTAPSAEAVADLWKSYYADESARQVLEATVKASCHYDAAAQAVDVEFATGEAASFHALWLRDACKSPECCKEGMRPFMMSAHIMSMDEIQVTECSATDTHLKVTFSDGHKSRFPMKFLKLMAPYVAKPIRGIPTVDEVAAHKLKPQKVWDNETLAEIPRFHIDDLRTDKNAYSEYLKAITYPGVAIVKGVPQHPDMKIDFYRDVMMEILGKFSMHPIRDNSHWTISTTNKSYEGIFADVSKQSLDYVAKEPLLSHNDHSDYLGPAFMVCMHVAAGKSENSVTDGFAAAEALRRDDPESYRMLTEYNQSYARLQEFYEMPLHKWAESPIINRDENGHYTYIRFSEGKRNFFNVPYEDFPKYWKAYKAFSAKLEDPKLKKIFRMEQGDVLCLNNHRTVHGRVSIPGGYRVLLGNTFGKDTYVNRVRGQGIADMWDEKEDEAYFVELPHAYYDGYMHDDPATGAQFD